ncbi:hypothetical protein [Moheibacter stercoris]|uniref:Protein TonB n=1 Tax=Moheibacter stercoris TaxID=1628251 RepID=A0ABV2LRM4_9FLAO
MSKHRQLSWDDYLFQNRHKAYGAYALRTGEGRNLLKSLLIGVSFIGILVLVFSFTNKKTAEEIPVITCEFGVDIDLTEIPEQPKREKPVLPTAPKVIPPTTTKEKLDSDIIPEPTNEPSNETPLNKNENIGKTEVEDGQEASEGSGVSQVGHTQDGTENGLGDKDGTNDVPEIPAQPEKIFQPRDVSKMAIFPGCEKATKSKESLQICMAQQLNKELGTQLDNFSTIAERYNIDKATTKLQFIVNHQGKIVQVKAIGGNNQHFSKEAQEAMKRIAERLIQRGKIIQPAEMNDGSKVNMSFTLPVQFMVQ